MVLAGTLEERSKKINRSFAVKKATNLEVSNRYGKVHVNVWDEPTCKVDVEVIVEGRSAERADELLDEIDVLFEEGDSFIEMRTRFGDLNTRKSESFQVNYTLYLPAANPLSVSNQFGDIYLESRSGGTEVELKYGNLKAGDISGFLDLVLEFGGGAIDNIQDGELEVKYSDFKIESARNLEFEQQFSDIRLGLVKELDMESKYGDVELGRVQWATIDAQFSGLAIDRLDDYLKLSASYVSGFKLKSVNKDFTEIDISGKFSDYTIDLPQGVSADLEARFSFSDMKMERTDADIFYREKESNRSEYKARIGDAPAKSKITVRSSYGDLTIR